MLWLAIGFAIAICVALNRAQWPRKKLDKLAERAVADFERRTNDLAITPEEFERAKQRVQKRSARANRVTRWDWNGNHYELIAKHTKGDAA